MQASKLAEQTPAKAHSNAPADLPGPPNLILENGRIGLILTLPKFYLGTSPFSVFGNVVKHGPLCLIYYIDGLPV